jgi:hypothetical protein
LPPFLVVGGKLHQGKKPIVGEGGGTLGGLYDPFRLEYDAVNGSTRVPALQLPGDLTPDRLTDRRRLLAAFDRLDRHADALRSARALDDYRSQAFAMLTAPATMKLFDLGREKDAVRDRYGRTRFGQSCLLARRLIERGVRFVTVNMFETVFDEITWDIHGSRPFTDITEMARLVAPNFDRAYSTLLEDLKDRGLLETTIVTAMGEFGRTPKINPAGGRDHHPGVWTILLGGGPIQGGRVVGESDELGYAPKSRPVTPGVVAATIYKGLGLDPHRELPGPQNRPLPLADYDARPLKELF